MSYITRFLALIVTIILNLTLFTGSAYCDEALDKRANNLFKEIRCQVCQGESIYDSQVRLAKDMRKLIQSQIKAGKSDAEIKTFLKSSYGDNILLYTPMGPFTYFIWLFPFIAILGGILVIRKTISNK